MHILRHAVEVVVQTFGAISPKDILLLALGAACSIVVRLLFTFFKNYRAIGGLQGVWHAYHWSRIDLIPHFVHSIIEIKRRIYGVQVSILATERMRDPLTRTKIAPNKDLSLRKRLSAGRLWKQFLMKGAKPSYFGSVRFDGSDVLIDFEASNWDELGHLRLTAPILREETRVYGIAVGKDYDQAKFSSVRLCSKEELSPKEAAVLIAERACPVPAEAGLRLSPVRAAIGGGGGGGNTRGIITGTHPVVESGSEVSATDSRRVAGK